MFEARCVEKEPDAKETPRHCAGYEKVDKSEAADSYSDAEKEPTYGVADIIDISNKHDAEPRGDTLSPKMGNIGQNALCQLNLDLVMSSPLHFDLTKRGSTEAKILEMEGSEGAENEN